MAKMTIEIEGSDMTLELLKRAMAESPRTTFCPESIWPGYSLTVVGTGEVLDG